MIIDGAEQKGLQFTVVIGGQGAHLGVALLCGGWQLLQTRHQQLHKLVMHVGRSLTAVHDTLEKYDTERMSAHERRGGHHCMHRCAARQRGILAETRRHRCATCGASSGSKRHGFPYGGMWTGVGGSEEPQHLGDRQSFAAKGGLVQGSDRWVRRRTATGRGYGWPAQQHTETQLGIVLQERLECGQGHAGQLWVPLMVPQPAQIVR
mmetsp:Transcript_27963/g.47864  ORF Transcript_27963/g.47864 Transcript_27963/m.47864 type:complete len:207 (+) Transcript_27963:874-1494(+)